MFCSVVIGRCYLRLGVVYAAIDIVLVVIVHFYPERANRFGSKYFDHFGTYRFTYEIRHATAYSFRSISYVEVTFLKLASGFFFICQPGFYQHDNIHLHSEHLGVLCLHSVHLLDGSLARRQTPQPFNISWCRHILYRLRCIFSQQNMV